MPCGRKRKRAASEHEPLATTTDSNTARDVGGPDNLADNSTNESGRDRTGNTTETADSQIAAERLVTALEGQAAVRAAAASLEQAVEALDQTVAAAVEDSHQLP